MINNIQKKTQTINQTLPIIIILQIKKKRDRAADTMLSRRVCAAYKN